MNYFILVKLLIFILLLNIIASYLSSYYFIKNNFPEGIIYPIKDDIQLPFVEKGKTIPKKIYRTCKKSDKEKFKKAIDKTQEIMTGHEQIIFDDDMIKEFIKKNYSERVWKAYDSIDNKFFPAKADLFRYLLIYIEGGIYLDIKSAIVKDLNPILDKNGDKLLISHWTDFKMGLLPIKHLHKDKFFLWAPVVKNNYGEYQNWYVISPKGNPILREVIKQVITNIEFGLKKNCYTKGKMSVLACTGPIMYSLVISKNFDKNHVKLFKKNLNDKLKYSYVNHYNLTKGKHYSKLKNLNILKIK